MLPEAPPKPVRIDFDRIMQRIVALPLPARGYRELAAGKTGVIYYLEPGTGGGGRGGFGGGSTLSKYDLKIRKAEKLADNVQLFDLSANGEKMLLRMGAPDGGGRGRGGAGPAGPPQYVIASASAPVKAGEGALRIAGMEVNVEPLAEWKQMYHEVWRIERSYFYDPNLHGVNSADGEKEYEKYLDSPGLARGLELHHSRFPERIHRWPPARRRREYSRTRSRRRRPAGRRFRDRQRPLSHQEGLHRRKLESAASRAARRSPVSTSPPETISLSINGDELKGTDDISRLLEGTADKTVVMRVASDASGANAREIAVVPVASEQQLRHEAWVEENRRKVDQLSGGKLAYVYMPDTAQGGLTAFNRYYFAQVDKQGAIIDERFNSGGQVADYVINALNRPLMGWWQPRYGAIYRTPAASVFGPKVMIINEMAGSGGDMMPWMFRHTQTGTLVGKRTWGGLVGVSQYPVLMDGGNVTSPNFGFFNPNGQWDVENHGTPPDVMVDQDPKLVHEGHDPQLERAVAVALEQMKTHPVPEPHRPAFPNYQNPNARPAPTLGSPNHRQ